MYAQLAMQCLSKYKTSKNPFTFACSAGDYSIELSNPDQGSEFLVTAKNADGSICMQGEQNIRDLLFTCKEVTNFSCVLSTNTFTNSISVSGLQVEILREISHYLNKALVFVSLENNKVNRVSVVTSVGCAQTDGSNLIRETPPNKLMIKNTDFVYSVDTSYRSIIEAGSIPRALIGGANK